MIRDFAQSVERRARRRRGITHTNDTQALSEGELMRIADEVVGCARGALRKRTLKWRKVQRSEEHTWSKLGTRCLK